MNTAYAYCDFAGVYNNIATLLSGWEFVLLPITWFFPQWEQGIEQQEFKITGGQIKGDFNIADTEGAQTSTPNV